MDQLQQLIDFIQGIAPSVWGLYLKQVYINGWTELILAAVLLVIVVILILLGRKYEEPIAIVFAFVAFLFAVVLATSGVQSFLNPEYFAITDLLAQAKNLMHP